METKLNPNPNNPKDGESTEYDGTKTRYSSRELVKILLVDLDGCISDDSARRAKLPFGAYGAPMLPGQSGGAEDCKLKSADFDAYCENACDDPAAHVAYLRDLEQRGAEIVICTARSAKRANDTWAWLKKHNVPFSAIAMRRDDDTTPAPVLKVAWALYLSQPSTTVCPGELRYEVDYSRFWHGMRGERYTLRVLGGIDDRLDVLAAYEAAGFKSARLLARLADETAGALQLMRENFPCVLDGSQAVPTATQELRAAVRDAAIATNAARAAASSISVCGEGFPPRFKEMQDLANLPENAGVQIGHPPPKLRMEIDAIDMGAPGITDSDRVPEILRAAAATFEERNPAYGSSYKKFGAVLMALYPEGVTLSAPEEFERFGLLVMVVGKVQRYCARPNGHKDSAHDLINYAAMLEELTP